MDELTHDLGSETDAQLWEAVKEISSSYRNEVAQLPIQIPLSGIDSQHLLKKFTFASSVQPIALMQFVSAVLRTHSLHFANPKCFSRFNPATTTLGAVADALTAIYNPQLAAWGGAAFPIAVEQHLLKSFGEKFGYPRSSVDGTFASGGSEANHTAILCALTAQFSLFAKNGLRRLSGNPVLFVSSEAHHSFHKAARACGLGLESVIEIPVNSRLQMDCALLAAKVKSHREQGDIPFLVVGTLGTTSSGAMIH